MEIRALTIGIAVSDLAASVNWYRKVFELDDPEASSGGGTVEFNLGEFRLQLEQEPSRAGVSGVAVHVETTDLPVIHQRLIDTGIRVSDIEGFKNVMEYFEAVDADGNRIGFVEVLQK